MNKYPVTSLNIKFLSPALSPFQMTPSSIGAYSNYATQGKSKESWFYSRHGQDCYLLQKLPDRLWGPPSLLFSWYRGLVPRTNIDRAVKSTTHLHLFPRLRISGAIFHSPIWLHGVYTNNSLCYKWTYTVGFTSRSKRPMREIHSLPSKPEVCMWCFTSEHIHSPNHHLMSRRLGTDKIHFSRIHSDMHAAGVFAHAVLTLLHLYFLVHALTRTESNRIYVRFRILQRNKQQMTNMLWSTLRIPRMTNSHT